ncbi:MAG TPA: hypothetical protein VIX17_17770 [Pyrinomonadaceae bacterium]|jgi:erythromycin esterase-like protein
MAIAQPSLIANAAEKLARPTKGNVSDYDELLNLIHEARFVLLGEATHGTHEFSSDRASQFSLPFRHAGMPALAFGDPRLERAIGVIYVPDRTSESLF